MLFGDVHVAHSPKNITQKYIKMSNMDITKNITQKYIKLSNMDITKKHNTEIYKDELHGVAHLYIFLCYVVW
jgi:hypothetical protein